MFPLYDNIPTVRTPFITIGIIIINAAIMLWMATLPDAEQQRVVIEHGFVPARIEQLSDPKLIVEVPLAPDDNRQIPVRWGQPQPAPPTHRLMPAPGEIYASAFTAMFLHGGWLHLIGNMWFLWLFGNNVEDRLGHVIYICFYLVGGLLATACHWMVDPGSTVPVVGASGAIAAVLGAYVVTYPFARVRTLVLLPFLITVFELPAYLVLGAWFVMQLLDGIGALRMQRLGVSTGVAFWAHVGGFVAGMLLMPLLAAGTAPPDANWHKQNEELFG